MKNIWKNAEFYCMNHDEPVKLYVYEGSRTPFYACPRYMLRDADHPDGHAPEEKGCDNRLSFDDALAIIEKLSARIEEALSNGEYVDFTGMVWKFKTIRVKILEYSDKGIRIGVRNTRKI